MPHIWRSLLSLSLVLGVVACGNGSDRPPGFRGDEADCSLVEDFDAESTEYEEEVLRLVNDHRAAGADCGSEGQLGPTEPLVMEPRLRCAARLHTRDMVERMYFDHFSPEGYGPAERIEATGYAWQTWGENISGVSTEPEGVVQGWMDSDGHCANIMNPSFEEIGVGRIERTWTQVFATPR